MSLALGDSRGLFVCVGLNRRAGQDRRVDVCSDLSAKAAWLEPFDRRIRVGTRRHVLEKSAPGARSDCNGREETRPQG